MTVILGFLFLNLIAIIVVAGISYFTYIVFFKKYNERINKVKENDVNTATSKLKYCLECGELLDKKKRCKACSCQY